MRETNNSRKQNRISIPRIVLNKGSSQVYPQNNFQFIAKNTPNTVYGTNAETMESTSTCLCKLYNQKYCYTLQNIKKKKNWYNFRNF